MDWIIGLVLASIVVIAVFLLNSPETVTKIKKKKKFKKDAQAQIPQKNWEEIASRLEKKVKVVEEKLQAANNALSTKEKEVMDQKAQNKKLHEQLSQQNVWMDKEQKDLDKDKEVIRGLQEELRALQESYSGEHAQNLKIIKEIKEAQSFCDSLAKEKRRAEGENAGLKAKNDALRLEIAGLKKDNLELKKTQEDTAWVAKSDYVLLEKQMKEQKQSYDRIVREFDEFRKRTLSNE